MRDINFLFVGFVALLLGCDLCDKIASLEGSFEGQAVRSGDEIAFSASGVVSVEANAARGNVAERKSDSVGLSENEKRFGHLKGFLGGAVKVDRDRKNGGDIFRYEGRMKAFLNWLEGNDPDHSKRNLLAGFMKKVFDLVKEAAQKQPLSHEFNNLIGWIKGSNGDGEGSKILIKAGITTISDVRSDDQVEALIKAVLTTKICDGTALSVFFQKLNDVFDGKQEDKSESRILERLQGLLSDETPEGPFGVLKEKIAKL
nr:hypothetical protein LKV13_04935 [Borrelia sp. BU AG58]